ncbi:hypothetical protein HPB51_020890 [Rhipicephalus microplus]|uniref:Uncharacterized protein n=1 Tax=Rhipicephalus microplus TaxID=6941 RepID=A0A9J6EUZ5_RHIMP|nr:hypothetical protein HPB51_020890 [Rhipicephalus microplus]
MFDVCDDLRDGLACLTPPFLEGLHDPVHGRKREKSLADWIRRRSRSRHGIHRRRMPGLSRAVTAADAGRGFSCTSLPKDYRLILPPLHSGGSLRCALVVHCDIAARPYGNNDFRMSLKNLGIIQEVSGMGAYQISNVWHLKMKTDEAKKILLDTGLLSVKDQPCVVVDPERQEVRLKLYYVAFDVNAETLRRAFREYGEVKEVISDKCRDEGFEGVEPTTRVPRCIGCRAFGHDQVDCTRSYTSAASRAANTDHTELLMNKEEAERVVALEAGVEASHAVATSEREMETLRQDTDESTVMGTPTQRSSTRTEIKRKPEPVIGPDATSEMDTVDTTPVKRRLNERDAASQQQPTQENQGLWRVAGSKKSRGAGGLRSSSFSHGGNGTTP